jgi:preprotein translocase subunit SecD
VVDPLQDFLGSTTTTTGGETTTTGDEATATTADDTTATTPGEDAAAAGDTTTTQGDEPTTTTTVPAETTTTTTIPGLDPETGLTSEDDPQQPAWLASRNDDGSIDEVLLVDGTTLMGDNIREAVPYFDQTQWVVQLRLDSEGADEFEALTKAAAAGHVLYQDPRRRIAIVLDGEIVSAPWVTPDEGIAGGSAIISVTTQEEAQDLAVVLRYGALPINFERLSAENVSATLGADSLRGGLVAGVGGLILVAIVVLLFYRVLGLVTLVGISIFGSLLVTILGLLSVTEGVTLTLAGVTGIIVSIGITADSYIVYFERIKEEIRQGRPLVAAVEEGFSRAFRTILTADTVSFMAAFLLYVLAIGPVKGFALSLGIATAVDVVVAYFFTRNAVGFLARSRLGEAGAFSIRAATGRPREATA